MNKLTILYLFLLILFTSIFHVDSFLSSIFGGGKKEPQFVFRTFFEGDWKLQKKTARINAPITDDSKAGAIGDVEGEEEG